MPALEGTFRERLLRGDPLHFRRSAPQADRTVPADLIVDAARAGAKAYLYNAVIEGELCLRHVSVSNDFSLVRCHLKEAANFSFATFNSLLVLSGTQFAHGATFKGATLQVGARLTGTKFLAGRTSFEELKCRGVFSARRARFAGRLETSFAFSHIEKSASFAGAVFNGNASFIQAHIAGEGDFRGVTFARKATFNAAKVEGTLFFRSEPANGLSGTVFRGTVDFVGAEIGSLDCRNAKFCSTDEREAVTFASARIAGEAFFDGSTFSRAVSFYDLSVEGALTCLNCVFSAEGGLVTFERAAIGGNANFDGAIFEGDCKFAFAKFSGALAIGGATLKRQASFDAIQVAGPVTLQRFVEKDDTLPPAGVVAAGKWTVAATRFDGYASFIAARFRSSADFRGAVFSSQTSFNSVEIVGVAEFNYTGEVSIIISANRRTQLVEMPATRFDGKVDFTGARFGSSANFIGTIFAQDVDFNIAQFAGIVVFRTISTARPLLPNFGGKIDFTGSEFLAHAYFSNSFFSGDAIFTSARFSGLADFWADFAGNASFVGTRFGAALGFRGAFFSRAADFSLARFEGPPHFEAVGDSVPATTFGGVADFTAAQFGPDVSFSGAGFREKGDCAKFDRTFFGGFANFQNTSFSGTASFAGTHIRGRAFFLSRFAKEAIFIAAHFEAAADFRGSVFEGPGNFSAARMDGPAFFNSIPAAAQGAKPAETVFSSKADFDAVLSNVEANFSDTVFKGAATFREASFSIVRFAPLRRRGDPLQFEHAIDLRGCTYEHLDGDGFALLQCLAGLEDPNQYDRQPFGQLEKVYHLAGLDHKADRVYLERRVRESENLSFFLGEVGEPLTPVGFFLLNPLNWLGNRFYRWVLNYGVRPYRLIGIAIICLLLGVGTLSERGAVLKKDPKSEISDPKPGLAIADAARLSLNQFLPVEVPMGSQWKPSTEPVAVNLWIVRKEPIWSKSFPLTMDADIFTTWFLRLPGWFLVPICVAAFGRLLRGSK